MTKHKGEYYYQTEDVANQYDDKRFTGRGGEYIVQQEWSAYLDLLNLGEAEEVLDVATGTGRLALQIAGLKPGLQVTGCDISTEMLNVAADKAETRNMLDRTAWEKGDAKDLPYDDNSFDVVTAQRFLHLVEDHQPYVEEMKRVARDAVIYDYFNAWSARVYDSLLPMGSYTHRPAKIRSMLQDMDLEVTETRRLPLPYGLIRGRSGPHIKLATGIDSLWSGLTDKANTVVYVKGELNNEETPPAHGAI